MGCDTFEMDTWLEHACHVSSRLPRDINGVVGEVWSGIGLSGASKDTDTDTDKECAASHFTRLTSFG